MLHRSISHSPKPTKGITVLNKVNPTRAWCSIARIIALSAALVAGAAPALALDVTTIVVAFPPGGATDVVARTLAENLGPRLNRTVIVDNKAGANGAVANNIVRQKPADGSTLYVMATYFSTAPVSDPEVHNYDPVKHFTPIARLTTNATVLAARANAPYSTVSEMLAYAATEPGKVNMGTSGFGANDHLGAVRLAQQGKVEFNMIHYKGAALAAQELMSGVLDLRMDSYASLAPALATGRVKLLAFATPKRNADLPNVPTVAETLPGYELQSYFGIVGPPGMAPDTVRKLSEQIAEVLKLPAVIQRFKSLGMDIAYQNPAEFSANLSQHLKSQQEAVKAAGFKK
jgi:tripartite-type tricarboxylate transporter receptor subunit TctC